MYVCQLIEQQKSSTNAPLAVDARLRSLTNMFNIKPEIKQCCFSVTSIFSMIF